MARTVAIAEPKPKTKAKPKPAPVVPDVEEEDFESGIEPTETQEPVEDSDDWMWLSQFTNNDWDHMICYLHRTFPITDRKAGGKPVAVEKICRPFDVDTVLKTHGSGGYRADVVSVNPKSGKHTRIRQFYFTVRNMEFPPKIPLGDWTQDPRNEEWMWAEPLLQAQQGRGGGMQQDSGKLFQTILEGVERVQGKREDNSALALGVLQMVRESNDRMAQLTDPKTQLSTLKELIAAVAPPQKSGVDPTMAMMFDMMKEQLKATREELAAMRAQAAKPTPSLVEQLKDGLPFIKELTGILGINKRNEMPSEWAEVAKAIVEQTGAVIPDIVGAWKMKIAVDKGKIPPAVTQQNRMANGSAAATASGEEALDPVKSAIVEKHGQLLIAVAPFMIDHFKTGLGGVEFRNWFISRQGIMAWTTLRDDVGVDMVVELTQMHPVLKGALMPVDKFRAFMGDFFSDPTDSEFEPPPDEEGRTPDEIIPPGVAN